MIIETLLQLTKGEAWGTIEQLESIVGNKDRAFKKLTRSCTGFHLTTQELLFYENNHIVMSGCFQRVGNKILLTVIFNKNGIVYDARKYLSGVLLNKTNEEVGMYWLEDNGRYCLYLGEKNIGFFTWKELKVIFDIMDFEIVRKGEY